VLRNSSGPGSAVRERAEWKRGGKGGPSLSAGSRGKIAVGGIKKREGISVNSERRFPPGKSQYVNLRGRKASRNRKKPEARLKINRSEITTSSTNPVLVRVKGVGKRHENRPARDFVA